MFDIFLEHFASFLKDWLILKIIHALDIVFPYNIVRKAQEKLKVQYLAEPTATNIQPLAHCVPYTGSSITLLSLPSGTSALAEKPRRATRSKTKYLVEELHTDKKRQEPSTTNISASLPTPTP